VGQVTLVLGGQKSGKSSTAARLATATGETVVVVTPAEPSDEEMVERIARHRRDRPAEWTTVETFALVAALTEADDAATVIVDALDTWLAHAMSAADLWTDDDVAALGEQGQAAAESILGDVSRIAAAAVSRTGETIFVAGQPGFGLHPMNANGRRYTDLHGLSLQRLAAGARVLLVAAGRTVEMT
jgi:adenosyl cobinamide kinase/adenosyl cobinamide phosphate guanylyltransferase